MSKVPIQLVSFFFIWLSGFYCGKVVATLKYSKELNELKARWDGSLKALRTEFEERLKALHRPWETDYD
jgi:hypothetical protein